MLAVFNRVVHWPYLTDENNMKKQDHGAGGGKNPSIIHFESALMYVLLDLGLVFPLHRYYTPLQMLSYLKFRQQRSPNTG